MMHNLLPGNQNIALGLFPGRVSSLWDIMRRFDVSGIFTVIRAASTSEAAGRTEPGDKIDDKTRRIVRDRIMVWEQDFIDIGLSGCKATTHKIWELMGPEAAPTWAEFGDLCGELLGRLIDETDDKVFFQLNLRESDIYQNPRRGWETAIARFPKTLDDVEESSKCYAMSRYPAGVFHSLQVVEVGLIELGTFLKVKDPHSGWTAVAGALKKVIDKKHPERSRFERKNFVFLEQVQGTVEGLKNAWRNKISHVDGRLILMSKEFSSEIAEEILFATRAFIRRLAEGLPPEKPKKKGKKP